MIGFKVDQTGRSTTQLANPKRWAVDKPFVQLSSQLLASPAMRRLGINARRVLDRLLCEQAAHASLENGRLIVTYDQFVEAGCSRGLIPEGIRQLVDHGLAEVVEVGGIGMGIRRPSFYRLTMFPANGHGPTHEWKRVTDEKITKTREGRRTVRERARSFRVAQRVTRAGGDGDI